jgi:DNA gyrase inhibitor GyrI
VDTAELRIVHLGPMRVAYFSCVGRRAERQAWDTLLSWADAHGHLATDRPPRFFGFDNPAPTEGSSIYGYEVWMTVSHRASANDSIRITQVQGGTHVSLHVSSHDHPHDAWTRFESLLAPWLAANSYEVDATRQWLREHIPDPDHVADLAKLKSTARWVALDLFMPIKPALNLPPRR